MINSYRGMETLGNAFQLKNNKELILKLFEIEEDESIVEVFTHLKALYEEQWGDAEATAPPEVPGCVEEDPVEEDSEKSKAKVAEEITDEAWSSRVDLRPPRLHGMFFGGFAPCRVYSKFFLLFSRFI